MTAILTISQQTQHRFVLGTQGLYPGRRWQGRAGVTAALRSGAVVQVDPLNVVARSHDIALYGRVLDYQPSLLYDALYVDRMCFETGGTVMIHPIEELPYWRVVLARKQQEPRRSQFAQEHAAVVELVRQAIQIHGPRSAADLQDVSASPAPVRRGSSVQRGTGRGTFRSGKVVNQALEYLWIAGDLLTHHRQGLQRVFELRERLVPAPFNTAASADEADAFFAVKALQRGGLLSPAQWRSWFAGMIARSVPSAEAAARLEALSTAGTISQVVVAGDAGASKTPCYVLTDDLPLLEQLHAGRLPDAWQPMETTTAEEMVLLAPLEIVSARGRALSLFGFEYLWEVYKPPEQRRWGYYTLPILYHERLVARTDLKLERTTHTLVVKGFWLEDHATITEAFVTALARAFQRFMRFIHADTLDARLLTPTEVRDGIAKLLNIPE